jgi:hypothetical protein
MLDSRRERGRKGRFGSLSEKNYYEMQKRAEAKANAKGKDKKVEKKPTGNLTAAQMKTKLERANRDNKRGMTKEEARNHGLTGDAGRKAAVKLAADRAKQKAAVDAEAERKAAEKKKMEAVDNAVTVASLAAPGAAIVRAGGRGLLTAAKKAGFNNVKDYKKYLAALSPKNVDSTGRRSPINLKRPNKPSGAKDTRKNQLSKKLSDTVLKTPFLGSRVARRLAQQNKAKEAREAVAAARKKASRKDREEMTMKDIGLGTFKKGGLVKKKGIDGIAMRGKTRATRSR